MYIYIYDFIKQPYPLCDRPTDTNFCLRVFSYHFYPHNGRGTEGERKGNGSSSLMLVLSSPQVRRSTRQGRLVTVACHCISRPLTWRVYREGASTNNPIHLRQPPGCQLLQGVAAWTVQAQGESPMYTFLQPGTWPTAHCLFLGLDLSTS